MKNFSTLAKALFTSVLFASFFSISTQMSAQALKSSNKDGTKGWVANPYDDKVFIENRGQFDGMDDLKNSQIYFGTTFIGVQKFFTAKGMTYRYDHARLRPGTQPHKEKPDPEEDRERMEYDLLTVHMEWLNSNPNVKIVSEDKTADYWNFQTKKVNTGIHFVPAYRKITYKDLYPGIDVVYTFHEKEGIKYSLIVHPGADPSQVKMKYTGGDGVSKDKDGNIRMTLKPFGDIIDQAPVTFYDNDHSNIVNSSFELDGNIASFKLGTYDKSKTLIIDPWTINPAFPQLNRAYDITKNVVGEVYVYGGGTGVSGSGGYIIKKYTSGGALLWSYATTALPGKWYGDMALDFTSNCYISDGAWGGMIIKLSPAGTTTYTTNVGGSNEIWRLAFDCNYKYLIAGGFIQGKQVANVNVNTGMLSNVSFVTGSQELRVLAIDIAGNPYSLNVSAGCSATGVAASNFLAKQNPAFGVTWSVVDGYLEGEGGQMYTNTSGGFCSQGFNGWNGIALTTKYVYTYDGLVVYKRNVSNGVAISNIAIPGTVFQQNSGICVDGCGNVYVGTQNSVRKYDSTLTFVTSIPMTGPVYDVAMGINNEVLVAGVAFVGSFGGLNPCQPTINVNATSTGTGCGGANSGTATASASGGNGGAYTYQWSNGQSSSSITGLSAGTYTVTVTDANGCAGGINTQTVVVSSTGGNVAYTTATNNPLCFGGTTGTASATVSTGTSPYTYSWSNGQTSQNATGLGAGTYTVTVTDATGCSNTKTFSITAPPAVVASITGSTNATCTNGGTATASGAGGTGAFSYSWSNGQSTQTATGLNLGIYTVTATDVNGCKNSTTVSILGTAGPTASVTNINNATCAAFGSASASGNGGAGSYTYSWSANGQTTQVATGLSAGTYTVQITDNNGCTSTATVQITGAVGPGLNTSSVPALCNGTATGTASVTATGGFGTYTYLWSAGSQATQTATGLGVGNYTVTVTDANGCTATATVAVTEPTVVTVTATDGITCSGKSMGTVSATAAGGTGGFNYAWSGGQLTQSATGLAVGVYTVTATDVNGCTATTTAQITTIPSPVVVFSGNDTAGCAPLCVTFTCTTANINNWVWDFGDGNVGSGNNAQHCYKNPGTYNVTLTITDINGCTSTLVKNGYINVFPNVVAAFAATPQPTTILNPTITFTDQSVGASTWTWTFGESGSSNNTSSLQNPVHMYKDSGCYMVELIADNQYNCPDTTERLICIGGDYELWAPNAFTPDGSGVNDIWNVKGIGIDPAHFKLWIFDRWGNLIFETSDLFKGWDGRANGGKDIAQQDVYVWKVATQDYIGHKHQYIGHVSLVR